MEPQPPAPSTEPTPATPPPFTPLLALRTAIAGIAMGIANLIPGFSGGTMVLALGLYDQFITAVADLTAFRINLRSILFLVILAAFAIGAIFILAGIILALLFHYPAAMFSVFIGLTLGGAPLLIHQLRPFRADVIFSTLVGLGLMVGLLLLKSDQPFPHNLAMDFVSGIVGATTMVLPGVSGSYVLLLLDQYERIVGAIDALKNGLKARDFQLILETMWIVVPVGLGVIIGIVALSNALKWLLRHYARPTLGILLGILLGSVVGLWPFGRAPSDEALERQDLEQLAAFVEHWQIPDVQVQAGTEKTVLVNHILAQWEKRETSDYAPIVIIRAVLLAVAGFFATVFVGRLAPSDEAEPGKPAAPRQP